MSAINIRLPKDLKERIARVAERAGATPHGFILEAIAEKTEIEERKTEFLETAERRYAGNRNFRQDSAVAWDAPLSGTLGRGSKATRPKVTPVVTQGC